MSSSWRCEVLNPAVRKGVVGTHFANVVVNADDFGATNCLWQVRWKTMRHPSLDYNDAISSSPFAHGVVVGPVSGGAAPGFTGPSAVPVASSFLRRQNAFPMQMQPVHHRPQSS